MIDKDEIILTSRSKVAYLMSKGFKYDRLEKVEDGQFGFVFSKDESLKRSIIEYNNNIELREYNSFFKEIALLIYKAKMNYV